MVIWYGYPRTQEYASCHLLLHCVCFLYFSLGSKCLSSEMALVRLVGLFVLFILAQIRFIEEERISVEERPPSVWLVGMSVRAFS